MRIVLDTNILARATPGRYSPANQLLNLILGSTHTLIVSEYLLAELRRVLLYERVRAIHGLEDEAIAEYVEASRCQLHHANHHFR